MFIMTKKSIFSRIVAVFLCALTLFSFSTVNASAVTSGGRYASTVNVTTKANYWIPGASSVTLKQDKQTLTYKKLWSNKTKTKKGYYGCYDITVYNATKRKTSGKYWGGGRTKKISLDPNCTYRITVSYNSTHTEVLTKPPFGYSLRSSSSPGWRVSSTWKVSSCY